MARAWLLEAQKGGDPAETMDKKRQAPSVADLCDRCLSTHAALHNKSQSVAEDRRTMGRYILPALGRHKAAARGHPSCAGRSSLQLETFAFRQRLIYARMPYETITAQKESTPNHAADFRPGRTPSEIEWAASKAWAIASLLFPAR